MATVDELREKAHEAYARARASLDPSTKQELLNLADDYLKQAHRRHCAGFCLYPSDPGKSIAKSCSAKPGKS
jgi:hypothetical protein